MKVNKILLIILSSFFINGAFAQQAELQWSKYFSAVDVVSFAMASSRFFYESYLGYQNFKAVKAINAPTLGTLDIPALKSISELMNVNPETKVFLVYPGLLNSPVAAGINALYLSSDIDLFGVDQQRFTLGHEFSHLIHQDNRNKHIISAIVPFVSFGLLKGYDIFTDRLIAHLKSKTQNSKVSQCLTIVGITNTIVAKSPLTHYLLSLFITSKLSQLRELRSDRESALFLDAAEAGISTLKRFRSAEFSANQAQVSLKESTSSIPWYYQLHIAIKWWDQFLGMSAHPSDEVRIRALEKLITNKL